MIQGWANIEPGSWALLLDLTIVRCQLVRPLKIVLSLLDVGCRGEISTFETFECILNCLDTP